MARLMASLHYGHRRNRASGCSAACPKQIDGPVAERGARLNKFFVERYAEGGTPELTSAVRAILTEGGDCGY